jgi:glucosamine--fructose-6-phosphate aminotransferase (isomerizing)
VQAIVSHTKTVVYLEDGEMAVSTKGEVKFYSMEGQSLNKAPVEITWSAERAEKAGYKHFMLKEIFEQPRTVAAALEPHLDIKNKRIRLGGVSDEQRKLLASAERIQIVACGTSYYAGMIGEYLIEQLARVPVELDFASEFRYRNPVLNKNSLVLVISQSGETADTLAALKLAKEQGAKVMSIVNVPNSTIDRESQLRLYMNSGPEIGVASTKAMTST